MENKAEMKMTDGKFWCETWSYQLKILWFLRLQKLEDFGYVNKDSWLDMRRKIAPGMLWHECTPDRGLLKVYFPTFSVYNDRDSQFIMI